MQNVPQAPASRQEPSLKKSGDFAFDAYESALSERIESSPSSRVSVEAYQRFWKHVEFDPNGCWLWRGSKNSHGYGLTPIFGKHSIAHRVAFAFWYEHDPGDMFVCHHCDTPLCCNPHHLFLGDAAKNNHDARGKGRIQAGQYLSRLKRPIGAARKRVKRVDNP